MRILSININNFSGENCKKDRMYKSVCEWRNLNKYKFADNCKEILKYIKDKQMNLDIIILQEFEIDTEICTIFKQEMQKMGFEIVTYKAPQYKNSSITVTFIKKIKGYKNINNPHKKNLRASIIETSGYIIYGVHCPMKDIEFWEELLEYFDENKNSPLIIVGDLNVFDPGTPQKKKYQELLRLGAIDSWIKTGHSHEEPTCSTNRRIDYAIMSQPAFEKLISIEVDHELRNKRITDHSAIILELHD